MQDRENKERGSTNVVKLYGLKSPKILIRSII